MKTISRKAALLGLVAWAAGTSVLCAQTDFAVFVNPGVEASSLDKEALKNILLGNTAYWPGGDAVTIVIFGGAAEPALKDVTGMSAGQLKTHWQRLTFSGRGKPPKEATEAQKAVALVAETKGAVALVPAGTEAKGVKKVEIK